MNNKKSPGLLMELSQETLCRMIRRRVVVWTRELSLCGGLSRRDRESVCESVVSQSQEMQRHLTSLPNSTCRLLIKNTLKPFAETIATYHTISCSRLDNMRYRRRYEEVCLHMFRAVYLPCMEECNISEIESQFVQELLSQLLHTNPNITRLLLPQITTTKVVRSVSSNLHILKALQEFNFRYSCTTDILIKLGRHCTLLKELDVCYSKLVTDDCVQNLMNLQSLEKLYVVKTKISETCYALLLSNLPRIQNIAWDSNVEFILQKITKECLPLVTEFHGALSDASLLRALCPHIKELIISLPNEKCLDLIHLTDVQWLGINICRYDIDKGRTIIANLGTRLTRLDMTSVIDLDITHIINCCCVLKILDFHGCEVVMSENFIFSPELPHFKSVKEITLKIPLGFEHFLTFLHHYVNLEFFHAELARELEHVSVSAILNAGGFRKLRKIVLGCCGPLTLQTAMLLIEKCDNLSVIGKVDSWIGVSDDDRNALFDFVQKNNLALSVLLE